MVHSLNIIHRCLNPLEPFIYICKEAQCVILYIGEELPITTYFDHRFLRLGALSYGKNGLHNWEASATFGFHGKVWVLAWQWATEGLRVKVTTPQLKRVMLAEDPTASSQTQDIDTNDEDQGLFIELMYNLIYLSSEKVCGKLG